LHPQLLLTIKDYIIQAGSIVVGLNLRFRTRSRYSSKDLKDKDRLCLAETLM